MSLATMPAQHERRRARHDGLHEDSKATTMPLLFMLSMPGAGTVSMRVMPYTQQQPA